MDCTDLYLKINHNLQENIQASLSSSHYTLFANTNAFIDDYGLWQKWIAEKYGIEIFSLALSEYETALLFAVQSLYKQAFSSLRAYLEHTLFGIQLTTNLLQYLNWKQDAQDVYWSQIVDLDSGLFSSNYTSAFFSELCASSKLILDLAKRVYRECSQFTHGNYSAWEVIKYPPVYDEKAFVKFLDEAESIKYIIEYSFFIRFIKEIPKEKITGTRYGVNIGCLLALEAVPTSTGARILKNTTTKRMSEYGASNSCYEPLSSKKLIELEASNNQFLQDQLAKSIDFLDLTDWQKEKLHSVSINTIGELAASNESAVMKAYYVGEVRAKQMKNAAYAALFEYLLG